MLVTKREATRFEYHGAAVHWLPSEDVQAQMRSVAERVAAHLKERYDYRGVFTVDGVAGEGGFYPTELNPRFGGAIARMATSIPDLPLLMMHYATVEGGLSEIDHEALRELILTSAAQRSSIRPMMRVSQPCAAQISAYFTLQDGAWVACEEEAEGASSVRWGPATQGSMLLSQVDQGAFEEGASTLEGCLALMRAAHEHMIPTPDEEGEPELKKRRVVQR